MRDYQNPPQVLVHLYRGALTHADVWRQRLDATTNWAVITTAAIITFAFGNANAPHFVVILALLFDFFFLFMESRRYQAYNLWQRRIRVLHRAVIVPALKPPEEVDDELVDTLFRKLADDFGTWLPAIPLWAALGYRIRRNYGPLATLIIFTWLLKLYIHPTVAEGIGDYISRASVGLVPGPFTLAGVAAVFFGCVALAMLAPSEQMREWRGMPAPLERLAPGLRPEGEI